MLKVFESADLQFSVHLTHAHTPTPTYAKLTPHSLLLRGRGLVSLYLRQQPLVGGARDVKHRSDVCSDRAIFAHPNLVRDRTRRIAHLAVGRGNQPR